MRDFIFLGQASMSIKNHLQKKKEYFEKEKKNLKIKILTNGFNSHAIDESLAIPSSPPICCLNKV